MRRDLAPGVLLVAIGLLLLALEYAGVRGEYALLVIGAVFLAGYAVLRVYGLLIPGAIFLGLGVGVAIEPTAGSGSGVLLGLGLGFVGIYFVDFLVEGRRRWWPLIPGTILVGIGALLFLLGSAESRELLRWWPLLLIALGVWLLVRRKHGRLGP